MPVTEIASPVDLAWRINDSALYLVGRHGHVVRVDDDGRRLVLDIDDITNSEGSRGLLGLAFSPDGAKAYVTFNGVDGATNLGEFAVSSDGSIDRDSLRVVMTVDQPYGDHNGGDLAFGPDGMLYVGLGDGGAEGDPDRRAQDLGDLLGKLLRLDPMTPSGDLGYTVPDDNPFVGVQGARGEIWSVGLRNPWRFSFDPETGDLWLTDVGHERFEEVNVAPALDGLAAGRGSNFGWSAFEGSETYNADVTAENHSSPIFEYDHSDGRCAISGGVRARGVGAGPLAGWYIFADYCTGRIMALAVTGERIGITVAPEAVVLGTPGDRVSAIASGPDGAVYVLSLGNVVFRIVQSLYRGTGEIGVTTIRI
jgi:glucose/arabinose dehydrogenase